MSKNYTAPNAPSYRPQTKRYSETKLTLKPSGERAAWPLWFGRTGSQHSLSEETNYEVITPRNGGAGRDRTDDLKLAKLPLSQLSYGPVLTEA